MADESKVDASQVTTGEFIRMIYCGERDVRVMKLLMHRSEHLGKTIDNQNIEAWITQVKEKMNVVYNPFRMLEELGIEKNLQSWLEKYGYTDESKTTPDAELELVSLNKEYNSYNLTFDEDDAVYIEAEFEQDFTAKHERNLNIWNWRIRTNFFEDGYAFHKVLLFHTPDQTDDNPQKYEQEVKKILEQLRIEMQHDRVNFLKPAGNLFHLAKPEYTFVEANDYGDGQAYRLLPDNIVETDQDNIYTYHFPYVEFTQEYTDSSRNRLRWAAYVILWDEDDKHHRKCIWYGKAKLVREPTMEELNDIQSKLKIELEAERITKTSWTGNLNLTLPEI